jgi:hypothetical protein
MSRMKEQQLANTTPRKTEECHGCGKYFFPHQLEALILEDGGRSRLCAECYEHRYDDT